MMRPKLFFRIPGKAARVVWNAEERLIARIASHFSIGNCSSGETCWMPALFTSTSMRPKVSRAVVIMSAMAGAFDMSAGE